MRICDRCKKENCELIVHKNEGFDLCVECETEWEQKSEEEKKKIEAEKKEALKTKFNDFVKTKTKKEK